MTRDVAEDAADVYEEHTPIVEQVRSLLGHLGLRRQTGSREALEEALDEIKRTALADFDQATFWGKRRNEVWRNRTILISALAELAVCDFRPQGMDQWTEIRAEELRPGMFVEDHRRAQSDSPNVLVVVYAHLTEGADRHLYLECIPADPESGNMGSSGGLFSPGTLVRACPGVSHKMG